MCGEKDKKKYFVFIKKKILIFFILFSLTSFEVLAANRFWVAQNDGTTKSVSYTHLTLPTIE